jgi:hypothetical protein
VRVLALASVTTQSMARCKRIFNTDFEHSVLLTHTGASQNGTLRGS